MNALTYQERIAIRNASTLASAQWAYDSASEPEPDEVTDLLERLSLAREAIDRAEACLYGPPDADYARLCMGEAADYLVGASQ